MAVDPTAVLQAQPQPDPGQTSAPQAAPQAPPQAPPPDPVSAGIDASAQYHHQQLIDNQMPAASGGPIRRLLQNFLGNMGTSMMTEAGIPTPFQKQQQAIQGLQADAAAKAHLATIQSLQAQNAPVPVLGMDDKPVVGSDGKPIMVPASHAASIYAARVAGQYKQDVAQTNIEGPTLTPEQAQAMGHPEMAGQGLNKALGSIIQNQAGKMPITQDMIDRDGLPPESLGKMATISNYLSAQRLKLQAGSTRTGGVWKETSPGQWTFMPTTTTTTRGLPGARPAQGDGQGAGHPLNQPGVPHQLKTFAGGGPVYAFDPKTNQTVLTTPAEAQTSGYTNTRKVTQPEIEKDRQLNNRLTDVATKITRYEGSMQKDLSSGDQQLLASALEDDQFKLGLAHSEIPVDWLNKLAKASYFNQMSPEGQKRLVAYFNAKEAMQGYQRVLSGSGHGSDAGMQLNIGALPNPLWKSSGAQEGFRQFKENIPIAAQGLPRLPGVSNAADVLNASGTVRVQIPGQPVGTISKGRLADFQKKYPNAQVLQ
jgi:hypothetical protein